MQDTPPPLDLFQKIRLFFYDRQLRKKSRRGRNIAPKILNPITFMKDLEKNDIDYTVLRWPELIQPIAPFIDSGDIDILIDGGRNDIADVLFRHKAPNGVKFDIYSATSSRGTNYNGYPYYPPHMAYMLLANKAKNHRGFFELQGLPYIGSLIYHLVYHKGSKSGIPILENDIGSATASVRALKLIDAAQQNHIQIPALLSLQSLEGWLSQHNLNIPYDLLIRQCDRNDPWISYLINREEKALTDFFEDGYFFSFLLREPVIEPALEEKILEFISKKFTIIENIYIPDPAREEASRRTRGGNWISPEEKMATRPYRLIICKDNNPTSIKTPNAEHPLIDNGNFFYKFSLREFIKSLSRQHRNGVHCGDNTLESAYIAKTVKGIVSREEFSSQTL